MGEDPSSNRRSSGRRNVGDEIIDIKRTPLGYILVTVRGEKRISDEEARSIYWDVKMRNRKKAFGL